MLNIIKMDLYKMFKSKSFYVLNIVLILITLSLAILIEVSINIDYETAKKANFVNIDENGTIDSSITEEEYYNMQEQMKEDVNVDEFVVLQYSGTSISILLVIFIAIFICSEWDTGFVKNIIPLKNSRNNLLVSKNITTLLFILIQAIFAMVSAIAANLLISGKVNIVDSKELMIFLGIQLLLRIAFASLLILISYLFRSKAAAMSIGILLAVDIHGFLLTLLDKAIRISDFNLSKLSIVRNIKMLAFSEFSADDYKRVIIMSIVYFLVYNIFSMLKIKTVEAN